MNPWLKKHGAAAAALAALATVVSLLTGIFWKVYAQERVQGTAEIVARKTVSDSLSLIRAALQAHQGLIDSLPPYMRRAAEDIGEIKDFMVELDPELYRKVKNNRALKK